jgi:nucleoid-associated protein YgaU
MWRSLVVFAISGLFMVCGVAAASPGEQIRIPVLIVSESSGVEDAHVTVRPGDHLWKISARHLQQSSPDSRLAPYWRRVVTVNTPSLRSGDPDLIYPGETITLPPIDERP